MVRKNILSRGTISAAILSAVFGMAALPAVADVNLLDQNGFKVDGAVAAGLAGFTSPGANFGNGTYPNNGAGAPQTNHRLSGHPAWTEYFLHPELKASFTTENAGTFYGDVSGMLTGTGGDGDASALSTTYGHPWDVSIENAYLGWKSGKLFGALGDDAVDLSGGRQSFRVADGFLISNGTMNWGNRGGFWTQGHSAFSQTGIARISSDPVRADVFYLQNDSAQSRVPLALDFAKTKVFGGNIEWFETAAAEEGKPAKDGGANYADRKWYVGGTFFHVIDAKSNGPWSFGSTEVARGQITNSTITNTLTSNRDGENVFSAHFGGNFVPMVEDFSFFGNYVYESNGGSNKVSANAWYLEPGYQLSQVAWTPKLSYRYSHFSGDSSPNDAKKTAYDPFFYNSVSRGYGSWFLGEIVGNYIISNSNVNVNQVSLVVNPTDSVRLSLFGYSYTFDQKGQYGANVKSDDLAKEIDFVAEWTINDHVSVSGAVSAAKAGMGGKQYLINQVGTTGTANSTWLLGETSVVVKF